jgi:hypothetical protein
VPISKQTLRLILRDFGLIELSDEEMDKVLPDVESQKAILKKIRVLDLSRVPPARQLRPGEGGENKC